VVVVVVGVGVSEGDAGDAVAPNRRWRCRDAVTRWWRGIDARAAVCLRETPGLTVIEAFFGGLQRCFRGWHYSRGLPSRHLDRRSLLCEYVHTAGKRNTVPCWIQYVQHWIGTAIQDEERALVAESVRTMSPDVMTHRK